MKSFRLGVLVSACCALILTGCAGGMSRVKRAMEGPGSVYVMDETSEIILHLDGLAGGEILGRKKSPESFGAISVAVADTLKGELGKKNIYTSREDKIPNKKVAQGFDEVEVPDWSKRNYKTILSNSVHLTYLATPSSEGTPPYRYKLRAEALLRVGEYKGGDLKMLMPSESGVVELATLEKELDLSTGQIMGLESLMKAFPPERILPELKERTRQGVRRFVREMRE